jgi:hypothetical protein
MDSTQIATTVGVISAAAGGILTWASTQGINAWLKYRADRRVDEVREDEQEDSTLRFIIGRQDGEISSMRAELKEMQVSHRAELKAIHDQHNDCEKRHAELSTELRIRMEMMDSRMVKVEQHVDPKLVVEVHESEAIKGAVQETKAAIRDGVHDVVDRLSGKILSQQADQAEGKS